MASFLIMIKRPNGQCAFKGHDEMFMPPPALPTEFLVRGVEGEQDALNEWCKTAGFKSLDDAAEECQCRRSDIVAIMLGPRPLRIIETV